MEIRAGTCRIVFIFKNNVVKIPNFISGWTNMLWGFMENLHERYWYSADGGSPKGEWNHKELAEIKWADCFGFFVVMERLDVLEDQSYDKESAAHLEEWAKGFIFAPDVRADNIGVRPDGTVALIDYGYFARPHFIGDPVVYQDSKRKKLTWSFRFFFQPMRKFSNGLWKLLNKLKIVK